MIRISSRPHTLAPRPAGRMFVEDCFVIRAEPQFTRAAQPSVAELMLGLPPQVSLTATGLDFSAGRRVETVNVLPSKQRLGGRRWWWECPACGRRCGVLLTPSLGRPFWCRLCWGAVYRSDYRRTRSRDLGWLLGIVPGGGLDRECRTLAGLRARRRRGVRRGRRVRQRTERLAGKVRRWQNQLLWAWGIPRSNTALARVLAIEDDLLRQGLLNLPVGSGRLPGSSRNWTGRPRK